MSMDSTIELIDHSYMEFGVTQSKLSEPTWDGGWELTVHQIINLYLLCAKLKFQIFLILLWLY